MLGLLSPPKLLVSGFLFMFVVFFFIDIQSDLYSLQFLRDRFANINLHGLKAN